MTWFCPIVRRPMDGGAELPTSKTADDDLHQANPPKRKERDRDRDKQTETDRKKNIFTVERKNSDFFWKR